MSRRMRYAALAAVCAAVLGGVAYCLRPKALPPDPGPAARRRWARPVEAPGLENAFKVTESLYRGAQPTAEGMREIEKLGVRTVVNLRLRHSDREELEGTGLDAVRIKVEAWDADEDEVVRFLKVVTDPGRQPVFVHCKHGADRTGMMVAVYRMVVCGWSREEAIQEMTRGAFGYHRVWKDIVNYLERLDIDELRRKAALAAPGPPTSRSTSGGNG